MTSSRKRPRTFGLRRIAVIAGALGVFGFAVYAFLFLSPLRQDPAAARQMAERSGQLLQASNPTAARDAALEAVRADPDWADGHVILARALLMLEDGTGAEGELRRAIDKGFDAKQLHHLLAHALLLQGQVEQAVAEVEKTDPRYRPYGLRVRARAMTAQGDLAAANASLDEARRIAPNDPDVWTDVGRFRFTAGDMLGAIEASERAVKLAPGNIDALVLRGELVRAQYGLIAALPWFEAALKRDPDYHDALIEYASTLGDAGRSVDMLAAVRRAAAARPGSPQAFYLQSVLAARAGNYALARDVLAHSGPGLDQVPGALLLAGALDIQAGDSEQAIARLQQLVAAQPMNITARKLLATALLKSDAARNAIDVLRPVIARGDADSYALTLVARGYERIGERAEAARLLDRAAYPVRGPAGAFSADDSVAVLAGPASARPGDPQAIVPMIRALLDKGDKAGALAEAQAIARRNPGAPGAHVVVGDMLMLLDRPADAAAAYRNAADLRFDEPTMLRLVDALDRAGRRTDAANTLALFLSQNPVNVAALRLAGHWQLAAGEYEDAIETLEGLRERVGDRDAALNAELAAAYAGAGETDAAVEYGERAYRLAPLNPAVADAYGWALYLAGDGQAALELLTKAVSIAPGHAGLRWHLAQVYAAMDRKDDARAQAAMALKDPSFTERAAAQALAGKTG
ncbi:tetratricopeptide repeat protein [Sphingomonas canadensis]|uniref:Tetratricopeptide repeat protein n=1 Tax=Sphingomonas canadensis TaxID=1219257 RepID=A0ABW3H579_9SPHN|nr:tetratricopeptide repeat protein [Sphingomonas canadensis]MCW3835279.1 tetratricopeptide repeat protein [Sphingomonas canadensis]